MANKDKLNNLTKTKIKGLCPDYLVASLWAWLDAADVMSSDVITISPEESVASAVKIMAENNISCVIAVDNGSVAGILTETDILKRAVAKKRDSDKIRVADIMSSPVESIPPDFSILKASRIAVEKRIKRLPILKDKQLIGIITQTDLIQTLTSYGMWRDVAEIMSRDVAGIQRKETVVDAAKIMASRNISCVIALEANQVVGVLTERDLLKRAVALQKNPTYIKVEQVMSSPAISIPPSYSVFSASRIMEKMDIRRLVVMEDKRLCGIVTQTDIFRAIKKKLQAEEEKNFRLLENSKSSIYTIDLEGKTTYVNPSFMKLLDVSDPEELINQPFLPERFWLNPEKRARFLKRLLGGGIETMELGLKTSKGKKVYVTLFCTFTKNANGEINGNQGIFYDITAKKELVTLKQSEDALRESEERYRRITGAVTDYIYTVRFEGGQPVETIHGNACVAVTGYISEEFAADPYLWINMVYPEDREAVHEQVSHCISGQDTEPLEHRIVQKDGTIRWLKSTLVPHYDPQGNLLSYDGLLQDIAERKQAEEALEQVNRQLEDSVRRANLLAQEATVADLAKSQFLANMSHEIRTPMNAIIGFSEVLAEEKLTDEQKHYIGIIRESAENLLCLINDILDFSKIEAGKLNIEISDCSLERLFAVVEVLMRPEAEEKGLKFEILQCGKLPAQIRTDPVRLRQCLINLINNAIKFTEKGHVYVNVSLQGVDNKGTLFCNKSQNGKPEPYIRFDVEDTGIGIPPDKQDLIFEEFMQAEGGIIRRYSGTGLGLAITKRLAHLLNGELSVTSEVGKGSVFSLTIPAGVDVKSQPLFNKYNFANKLDQTPDVTEQEKFTGQVLVGEDSQTNQILINLLLERLGLQVTIAKDGKEVVDKALSRPFDLILMDIQMPNMNGYDATKALRKKGMTTPIVAMTAHAMKGDDKKCLAAGCNDYLAKPIDRRKLLETLHKYLSAKGKALSDKIDSVKSEVDGLSLLYADQSAPQGKSGESANAKSNKNIIDWAQLIGCVVDEELIDEIVPIFREDNQERLNMLTEAVKAGDMKEVKLYAHAIKGASGNMGAKRLSEVAHRLECAGQEKDTSAVNSLFRDVKRESKKVMSFLSRADWIEIAKQQGNNKQTEQLESK